MRLPQIDHAIEVCEKHLNDSKAWNTEIEIYLTGYLLVFMSASFEQYIEDLVNDRVSRSGDAAIIAFARSATSQLFRSLLTKEIGGLLGRFGDKYKERFQAEMKNNPRAVTFFNNIVLNRHGTAHKSGSGLTFREVTTFYSEAHVVLDAISLCLALT